MANEPTPPQGGSPAPVAAAAPVATPAPVSNQERDEFVTRLIGRHGTAIAALTQIAGEQLRFKRRAQAAERDAADLRKKVPADGSVVLTGDEAKAYTELKAKGVTLDKVPASLKTLADLQATHSTQTREQDLTAAAGDKYNVKVLKTLIGDTPLEFKDMPVMKADKSGVENVKVAYVVLGQGDKQTRELLTTYLEREHAAFKDVLAAKETESGESTQGTSGAAMPKQTVGAPTPKGKDAEVIKVVDRTLGSAMSPGMRRKEAAGK